ASLRPDPSPLHFFSLAAGMTAAARCGNVRARQPGARRARLTPNKESKTGGRHGQPRPPGAEVRPPPGTSEVTRRTALAGLAACVATPARGESVWPDRAITLVHGLAPGGP